ncbi:glycosyltransferase family 2 protein [Bacteroides sp.]|uniref:glycosyltransferase family 2 protein n=1 Tax=Bacteroides sp. TaxID=29523 RepID=UPI003AB2784F
MKVSVIIPVYNVAKYIECCLLSVLNQTWQDLEVILVDDCTPDDSMRIAEKVIVSHPCGSVVRCLKHEKNRGLSAARNTGISEATGEYLYFLDSDDFIPENAITLLASTAEQNQPDFVIGNYEVTGANRWAPPLTLAAGIYEGNTAILSNYVHQKWYVMAWNKLVNRSFLLQNNLYFQEGIVHEDDLWSFKLACLAQRMAVVNVTTYFYFMQPDSIMRAPSMRNLECRVLVLDYIFDFIQSSRSLQTNRQIYIFFENLKAKYFDRILYFTKDKSFRYQSYLVFREKKYISSIKALFHFQPGLILTLRNLHYGLPVAVGYLYFKTFVRLSYYLLILSIKIKNVLHIKQ